ncbi:hypothetical protein GCM10027418_05070 [Mariniluteicoccus endophyticus]
MITRHVSPPLALTLAVCGLSACGAAPRSDSSAAAPAAIATPATMVVEKPWVRSTEGSADPARTAAYMNLANRGDVEVAVVAADADVAQCSEIHLMWPDKSMYVAPDGVRVRARDDVHLAPGGPHIMLIGLTRPLPVGDEVTFTVRFSDGTQQVVRAPVKRFTADG